MQTVDKETLKNWLGEADLFLMDVRSPSAWNRSIAKIEHAQRFDPEKFSKMARGIPKNKKLVLYCEDGQTSCPTLAQELEEMGFTKLYLLEGGFRSWRGKDYLTVPKELS